MFNIVLVRLTHKVCILRVQKRKYIELSSRATLSTQYKTQQLLQVRLLEYKMIVSCKC